MNKLFIRFLLSFLLIILLIFVTVTTLISYRIKDSASEMVSDLTGQILQARAGQIGMWIDRHRSELEVLMESESFDDLSFEECYLRVKAFAQRHNPDFESIGLWGEGGKVWVTNDTIIDIREREYYRRITEQNLPSVLSKPIISLADKEKAIVVITVRRGKHLLNGAILLSWISDIAAKVEVMGQKAWIVDEEGTIVAHPDPSLVMGQSVAPALNKSLIRILAPIPSTEGWLLGVDIPRKVLFAQGNQLIHSLIGMTLIMAILSFALSLYLAKTLVRPIKRLQGLMFRAERGDLNVQSPGQRSDEIGQLERSFNSMIGQLQALLEQVKIQQTALRKKEMESMLNQIKPHFLYNSLDSIHWMAEEAGQEGISHMVGSLSRLFRISLSEGAEFIPLEQELRHMESYLQIQQYRYNFSFSYEIHSYPPSLRKTKDISVIKILLQPLVENAIYHGIKRCEGKGRIVIQMSTTEDALIMEVRDTGPGFSEAFLSDWRKGQFKGYGLRNIQERLALHFGSAFGITIANSKGAVVVITHPLTGDSQEDNQE